MTIINKIMFSLLLSFVITLFVSCHDPDPSYVNIYPSDIEIPGYGTLKYTKTLWDGKNQGTEIFNAVKIDNKMWIFTRDNSSFYINKGTDKLAANRIRLSNDYSYWVFDLDIITKGDYVLLFASIETKTYYLTRIHKNSFNPQYFKIYEENYDPYYGKYVYYGNDDVFIVLYEYDNYVNYPVYFYILNNDCDAFVESTEEAFNNFRSQNQNIIMSDDGKYFQIDLETDMHGRLYRSIYSKFEVSVDNGLTWHTGDMGTNIVRSIIIQDDSIYVFCDADSKWVSTWGTKSVGGGIHVFKWK